MYNPFRRGACLALALLLCVALTACGNGADTETTQNTQPQTETTAEKTEQTTAPTEVTTQATTEPETQPTTEATTAPETQAPTTAPTQPPKPTDPLDNPPPVGNSVATDASTAFFNESAFIGDSVTLKLRNYNTSKGVLGSTTFLCQGSYSDAHAVNNTMYMNYQGSETTPQDALAACGAKRVFILLGMNDIALHGIDKTMENWATLISNIRGKCPNIEIYIQSGTPIYLSGEIGSLNNANMDKYNVRLQAFAAENGCTYVDVNTPFKNSSGGLAGAYCSDEYVHFTDAACQLWVKILMEYVK